MNQEETQEPIQETAPEFCALGASLRTRFKEAMPTPTKEYEKTLHRYFSHIRTCSTCKAARNGLLAARLYARE